MAKPRTPKKTPKSVKEPIKEAIDDAEVVETAPPPELAEPVPEPATDAPRDAPQDPPKQPAEVAATDDAQAAQQKPTARVVPMVLGGALAAAIGFGAGFYLNLYGAQNSTSFEAALSKRDAQIQDLTSQLGTARADIAGLKDDLTNGDFVSGPQLKGQLAQARAEIDTSLSALTARVEELENRPADSGATGDGAALSAYQSDLNTLKAALAAQTARSDALAAEVQNFAGKAQAQAAETASNAKATLTQAALLRLRAALDSGMPFADALAEIKANTDIAIPPQLSAAAQNGVPTLAALQREFPVAARQALAASRSAEPASGTMGKLENFVMGQLGARSLEPKDGAGPDAILSRAEAALASGDIAKAMTEISALPAAGQEKMAPWQAMAETRMNATAAADALSQGIK